MAQRPYISFAEVKEKVSIPDVLDALGITDRFQRNKDLLIGICPLSSHKHGPNPNPEQFKINRKNGVWLWHCFGDCQKGGDVIELVKEITGFDDAHVRFWFAEKFGDRLTLSKPKRTQKEVKPKDDPSVVNGNAIQSPQHDPSDHSATPSQSVTVKPLRFRLNLKTDVSYLNERGLDEETIILYGLGLCNRGVLKGYIAIPVYGHPHEQGANPLAYLGRWPGDDFDEAAGRPRYKWPEGFLKSRIVYGLTEALVNSYEKPLIVVEGPFKVYHLFQAGFLNAVASFGSSLSDEQAAILAATGRPIVLMFDGDEAGRTGMRTAAGKLISKTFVRAVKLPDGIEPDDLSAEQLAKLLP
jgi:DNA primase